MREAFRLALLSAACAGAALAWQQPAGSGHWEGSIQAPGQDVAITVDLAVDAKGAWTGSMSMPAQGARDIPLTGIAVRAGAIRFRLFEGAQSPAFEGKLAADGASMSGRLSGAGESANLVLKRTGEAALRAARPSTAISNDFVGTWQGILTSGQRELRLQLELARGADGMAAGTLTSVELTGSPRIPVTTITQKDKRLELEAPSIAGSFAGTLNEGRDQISGQWTQAGAATPLVFHRVGAPPQP
ncbi:MAG TPA: hypothetical protein VMU19_06475 [Bryobacteraceae bacterium]|nr:hypothetical protein [Bryobacteraceae bacterium]